MPAHRGDIYRIALGNGRVRYFWDVLVDTSQLSSPVICVFESTYSAATKLSPEEMVAGPIMFYCHAVPSLGLKLGLWSKTGHLRPSRQFNFLFRSSEDYGNPEVRSSDRWYVWEPNGPYRDVGTSDPRLVEAEIGIVVTPYEVVERARTGKYSYFFPSIKGREGHAA